MTYAKNRQKKGDFFTLALALVLALALALAVYMKPKLPESFTSQIRHHEATTPRPHRDHCGHDGPAIK